VAQLLSEAEEYVLVGDPRWAIKALIEPHAVMSDQGEAQEDVSKMYRCYLTRNGRIAWVEYLDCSTAEEAKANADTLIMMPRDGDSFTGFEVWKGISLVCRAECQRD
jgi:hypothetical protein